MWVKRLGCQPVVVWQAMQLVAATGIWVLDFPVAPPLLPLWQDAQLVAALKLAWSTLAPSQPVVDLWQVSQTVCPAWTAVLGLAAAWQVAHWVLTLTLPCSLAGIQLV